MILYLDTSAAVKLLIEEASSADVREASPQRRGKTPLPRKTGPRSRLKTPLRR
jgi:predicted nucleic acid-binding protein